MEQAGVGGVKQSYLYFGEIYSGHGAEGGLSRLRDVLHDTELHTGAESDIGSELLYSKTVSS